MLKSSVVARGTSRHAVGVRPFLRLPALFGSVIAAIQHPEPLFDIPPVDNVLVAAVCTHNNEPGFRPNVVSARVD